MSKNPDHMHETVRQYVANRELAVGYDEYFSDSNLFKFDCDFISEELSFPRLPPGSFSLLDLGCGTGRHLILAAKNGCIATGIDLNPHMLKEALKNLAAAKMKHSGSLPPSPDQPVRLVIGDFTQLAMLGGGRFDAAIMMFSTLGLVKTAKARLAFLADVRSRIKPGGKIILHVHNELHSRDYIPVWSQEYLKEFALRRLGELEDGDHIQPNYRGVLDLFLHYFTSAELRQLLAAAGFQDIHLLPLNQRRDGVFDGPDSDKKANGFLLSAVNGASGMELH